MVATVAVAGRALAGAGRDPEQVRATAHDILGRDQYHAAGGNVVGDVLGWIADHLFPDSVRPSTGGGTGIFGDLVVLALVGGVAYLLFRVVRGWRPRARPDVPEATLSIDIDERRSATDWADLASRLEADGRFGEAVRARYGELVSTLIEDGSVAAIAGRTSGELRGDVVRTRPAGAAAFDEASTLFEAVWYGGADATAADAAQLRALGAHVLAAPRAAEAREREPVGVAP